MAAQELTDDEASHVAGQHAITEPGSELLEDDELVDNVPGNASTSPYALRVSLWRSRHSLSFQGFDAR
jgi:hypothetical protein